MNPEKMPKTFGKAAKFAQSGHTGHLTHLNIFHISPF